MVKDANDVVGIHDTPKPANLLEFELIDQCVYNEL